MRTKTIVSEYAKEWERRCYSNGIPDEVPEVLMRENLAPSWKQIAMCLLKNDMQMIGLGFTPKQSVWYGVFKRIELGVPEKTTRQKVFQFED